MKPEAVFASFAAPGVREEVVTRAVVNFAPCRIAGFGSEVLVFGTIDPDDSGDVIPLRPDADCADDFPMGGESSGKKKSDGVTGLSGIRRCQSLRVHNAFRLCSPPRL